MKILYVTTIGSTMGFFKQLVRKLLDEGYTVDIATNESTSSVQSCYREWGCKVFHISTSRSPFSFGNIRAVKEIRKIASNYDIVHCHTPLAAMATRLACKKRREKENVKVFYTAHGFHIYKGAPLINWIIYYNIEKICSKWTDLLITINQYDYQIAKNQFHSKNVEYVPGVGIQVSKFLDAQVDIDAKKRELNINDEYVFITVGELTKDKNHIRLIKAFSKITDINYKLFICGKGPQKNKLLRYINNHKLSEKIILLGFRRDIPELLKVSNCFVFPSIFEGLPVALMEAIASKTAIICSNCRGNSDLVSSISNTFKYSLCS